MAADARPYAFAMAALCASYLFFLRSVRHGRPTDFVGFCLSTALIVHLHLLLIYTLSIPATYLVLCARESLKISLRYWIRSAFGIAALISPLAFHYKVMFGWGSSYSFAFTPSLEAFRAIALPGRPLLFYLLAVVFCAVFIERIRLRLSPEDKRALMFPLLAGLMPLVLLFILSRVTEAKLFVPRYLMPATPGLALLYGWLLGRIEPVRVRVWISIFALSTVLAAQTVINQWHHEWDDWKGALGRAEALAAGQDHAIAIYTAYAETGKLDQLSQPESVSYLLSPLVAYPPKTPRQIAMPLLTDRESRAYWQRKFDSEIAGRNSFSVVLRAYASFEWWADYVIRHANRHGFRLANREGFGQKPQMMLLHFVRY